MANIFLDCLNDRINNYFEKKNVHTWKLVGLDFLCFVFSVMFVNHCQTFQTDDKKPEDDIGRSKKEKKENKLT